MTFRNEEGKEWKSAFGFTDKDTQTCEEFGKELAERRGWIYVSSEYK